MINDETKNSILELISSSYNIAIIPSKVAGNDAFAASLGLYTMLKSEGKLVSFIHPGGVIPEFSNLITKEEIISEPSQRELVVSVDYSETPASKVSYHTQGDALFLKITPINKEFDLNKVRASINGYNFDLIIVVGAQTLEDLGPTYNQIAEELDRAAVVNLDITDRNQRFGKVNFVDASMDSLSLLVLNNAINWGLRVDTKAAKALLKGVSHRSLN